MINNPWIPNNITGADQALRKNAGTYGGYALVETTGAASATLILYDNATTNSGNILDYVSLGPGESAREEYVRGIRALNGIYVKVVTGSVAGSVRTN